MNVIGNWLIKHERSYADEINQKRAYSNKLGIKSGIVTAVVSFIQQFDACAYIIIKVLEQSITVGDFRMYIGSVTSFSSAMFDVMSNIVELPSFRKYYSAMQEYLDIPDTMY